MSQTSKILDHLINVGSISFVEANDLYRCRSLTRRIADLREGQWPILSEWRRDALGQRYTRYSIDWDTLRNWDEPFDEAHGMAK